jgi:hypothetical protein
MEEKRALLEEICSYNEDVRSRKRLHNPKIVPPMMYLG